MVRLERRGWKVEVEDYLADLYKRNGFIEVIEVSEPEAEVEEAPVKAEPKKRTARRTTKK